MPRFVWLVLVVGACSKPGQRQAETPGTPEVVAQAFLRAAEAGDVDAGRALFDLESFVWPNAMAEAAQGGGGDPSELLAAGRRGALETALLRERQRWLREAKCTLGPVVQRVEAVARAGGLEGHPALDWQRSVRAIELHSLKCAQPTVMAMAADGQVGFEDEVMGLGVVHREGLSGPNVFDVLLHQQAAVYGPVLEALKRDPAKEKAERREKARAATSEAPRLERREATHRIEVRPSPRRSRAPGSDFNGDGLTDVVLAEKRGARVLLMPFPGTPQPLDFDAARLMRATPVGDVDGDGFDDLVVSLREPPGSVVQLHLGGKAGLGAKPKVRVVSSSTYFGLYAGTGDFNGDGYADVALFEPIGTGDSVGVFFGGPQGLRPEADVRVLAPSGLRMGERLAGVGDLDGDGDDELAVGAPMFGNHTGRVFLFSGDAAQGLVPGQTLTGDRMGARFGAGIVACDLNGDGRRELVVGGEGIGSNPSRLFVYRPAPELVAPTVVTATQAEVQYKKFGEDLVCAGDVDGDGFGELGVTASSELAYVYSGDRDLELVRPPLKLEAAVVAAGALSKRGVQVLVRMKADALGVMHKETLAKTPPWAVVQATPQQ